MSSGASALLAEGQEAVNAASSATASVMSTAMNCTPLSTAAIARGLVGGRKSRIRMFAGASPRARSLATFHPPTKPPYDRNTNQTWSTNVAKCDSGPVKTYATHYDVSAASLERQVLQIRVFRSRDSSTPAPQLFDALGGCPVADERCYSWRNGLQNLVIPVDIEHQSKEGKANPDGEHVGDKDVGHRNRGHYIARAVMLAPLLAILATLNIIPSALANLIGE